MFGRKVVFHLGNLDEALISKVSALPFVQEAQAIEKRLVVTLDNPETRNPEIVRTLVEAGAEVQFVGELRHSLEEVYLQLVRNS